MVIASTAMAMAVAADLAASSVAETADPAKQTAMRMATPTTSPLAGRERPRGLVLDCLTQSGWQAPVCRSGRYESFCCQFGLQLAA